MSSLYTLASRLPFWIQVTRLDRPVGWLVLLWPTWISLTLAAEATAWSVDLWVIFTLGVILSRSAGCVINDLTDQRYDRHVERTKSRPLTSGQMSSREALWIALSLLLACLGLVILTNTTTLLLSVIALGLAVLYPWLKRITLWPQIGLGLAFSMAIPMAFTAHEAPLTPVVWLLFLGNLCWTLAYDTYYAMVDRNDDVRIGIKSTAIAFGRFDLLAIGIAHGLALLCFAIAFWLSNSGLLAWLGVIGAGCLSLWNHQLARDRSRAGCFAAFLRSHRFGALLWIGLILDAL